MVGCLQGKTISGYAALVKDALTMPPGGVVWFIPMKKTVEATPGIEPGYKDLQSSA